MSVSADPDLLYRDCIASGRDVGLAAVQLFVAKSTKRKVRFRGAALATGLGRAASSSLPLELLGRLAKRNGRRAKRSLSNAEGVVSSVSAHETELHELMTRSLAGDTAAYRQFLEMLGGLFRAFFRRKLLALGPAYAEDLVQETLLAIHLHRHSYDPRRQVTAWVYAIARYKLIDHLRRTPASRTFVPVDDVEDLVSEQAADAADPSHDIAALLQNLPVQQSTAIRLVKLEALSAREASQRMGISEAAVKISIHRGLKKLTALAAKERGS